MFRCNTKEKGETMSAMTGRKKRKDRESGKIGSRRWGMRRMMMMRRMLGIGAEAAKNRQPDHDLMKRRREARGERIPRKILTHTEHSKTVPPPVQRPNMKDGHGRGRERNESRGRAHEGENVFPVPSTRQ